MMKDSSIVFAAKPIEIKHVLLGLGRALDTTAALTLILILSSYHLVMRDSKL